MVDISYPDFATWINEVVFPSKPVPSRTQCPDKDTCPECKAFEIDNEIFRKNDSGKYISAYGSKSPSIKFLYNKSRT